MRGAGDGPAEKPGQLEVGHWTSDLGFPLPPLTADLDLGFGVHSSQPLPDSRVPRSAWSIPLALLATTACAAKASPDSVTSAAADCPYRVVATVTNPRAVTYDVYYMEAGKPETIIGEISPGRTVTFPLPGEGKGRVGVRRPRTDIGSENTGRMGPPQEIRIRIHCSGG